MAGIWDRTPETTSQTTTTTTAMSPSSTMSAATALGTLRAIIFSQSGYAIMPTTAASTSGIEMLAVVTKNQPASQKTTAIPAIIQLPMPATIIHPGITAGPAAEIC